MKLWPHPDDPPGSDRALRIEFWALGALIAFATILAVLAYFVG